MGRCVALGCKEIGIYKFPSNIQLKRKWEKALKIVNFKSSDYSRLCRKHFKEKDFETTSKTTGFPLQRKFLKKSAVPSIFFWNESHIGTSMVRAQRLQQRNARRCLIPSTVTSDPNKPMLSTSSEIIPNINDENIFEEAEILVKEEKPIIEEKSSSGTRLSQATQTSTLFRMFSTEELLLDDESVLYYTGLETYEKFKLVLSTLCPMAHNLKYKGSQVINVGIEEQFLIMLIKLRRNKDDFELSKFFGVSKTDIANIFITWLNFTYDLWSLIDIWPERELVDYYMPSQFKKYHDNTRIIIDSIEIPIAKPKNPLSKQATFSSYKNKNTMKFLVGASPGGLYCYCSEGYGGSTSDRQMIERSDLLEKCESGDSIMANRSFNVQDIFAKKNIAVNIPAFPKGKSQLTGVRVKQDRQLASQRVHMERLIELSKTFTILKSDLNTYCIPLISRIFYVCVMLCNFREGIIKS